MWVQSVPTFSPSSSSDRGSLIYEVTEYATHIPRCGAAMRILAFVTDTASVTRILQPVGEPTQPPRVAPARGPPEWAAPDQSPAFDPEAPELAPAFEFDQTLSW